MTQAVELLFVGGSQHDVQLAQEALRQSKVTSNLWVAENGAEAMRFLRRQNSHVDAPRPDLILLDLDLPRKDGRDVLAELKSDESLRRIPVAVLTGVGDEDGVSAAYGLHANCCIPKPSALDDFVRVVNSIGDFWFTVVRLPEDS